MSRMNWRKWIANLLSKSRVSGVRQSPERYRRALRLEALESRRVLSTVQLLSNGNFATGDFTNWVTSAPAGFFNINGDPNGAAQYPPPSVVGPGAPGIAGLFSPGLSAGSYAVLEAFDGAGLGTVSIAHDVIIPTNSTDTLNIDYRAAWNTFLATQPRTFSVDIEPFGGGATLQSFTVQTAQPGTSFDTGNQQFSVDLSSFAGQSVRISLDEYIPEKFTGPGQLEIDNVSLLSQANPQSSTSTAISAPTIAYGQNGTVTVTESSPGGTPTGSVSLSGYGGTQTQTLSSSGSATFTLPSLNAGTYSLSASYDPTGNFAASTATGTLTVNAATPTLTVNGVTEATGTALDNSQLSGTATAIVNGSPVNVAGTFGYTTAAGAVLAQGSYTESVTFTPTDTLDYNSVTGPASVTVLGSGSDVVGTELWLIGSNMNDHVQVQAAAGGSTGIQVNANLGGVQTQTTYSQSFTAIRFFGYGGNDNFQMASTLTICAYVVEGDGNDNIQTAMGNDVVTLGNGNDNVQSGGGDNTVTAGNGNVNVQVGGGNNIIVTGNGNDNITAGNGDNLIVAGLGPHNVNVGNGSNILIDGSVSLSGGVTLKHVLAEWIADDLADIQSQLSAFGVVTDNSLYPNKLMAGSGLNWFWYTDAGDSTNRITTDLLN